RERADWMRVLEAHDVPAAPERLLDELADDAQVRHLEVFQQLRHPRHGPVTAANRAIRFDGDNHSAFAPPPAFGEHTLEVLVQAGFGAEDIERLHACGAIAATGHGAHA
ncbi:CoA transferase, partial [Bordetella pertussis]